MKRKVVTIGERNRFIIVGAIYTLVTIGFLSFNFSCGIYLLLLFILCTRSLFSGFIKSNIFYVFDAKNYFLLNFFLLHGIGYCFYLLRIDLGCANYFHDESEIILGLQLSILGLLFFLFAYQIGLNYFKIEKNHFAFVRIKSVFKYPVIKWFLLLIGVYTLFLIFWKLMGAIPFFVDNYHQAERAILGKGLGGMEALARSFLALTSLYFIYRLKRYKKFNAFSYLFLGLICLLFLLNGDRGGLINYLLGLCFIYYICVAKIKIKQYFVGFLLVMTLAGVMGVMRSNQVTDVAMIGYRIATEASVEFDNYVEVLNMFDNTPYLYGSTLIPIFTIPIPRAIFPEKDKFLTAGNYFKEYHNHYHIRVGERLSYIGELYMNWGILGIVIGMFILGLLLALLVQQLSHSTNDIGILLYIQLLFSITSVIAGDIVTAVISFFINNIVLIIFLILILILSLNSRYLYEKNIC